MIERACQGDRPTSAIPMKRRVKAILRWAATQRVLGKCLDPLARSFHYIWKYRDSVENTSLGQAERREVLNLIDSIGDERGFLLNEREAFFLYCAVKGTTKVEGDLAEVGVFQGASAKLICEAKGDRHLYLFDTFEGLPDPSDADNKRQYQFSAGQYLSDVDSVKSYLSDYRCVSIVKGMFPATVDVIAEVKKFSFVHLDVDLYQSTHDCIEYFYPRMSRGGIIISHDYVLASGVRKAVDEFFSDKPEPVIELCENQCVIVKT